MDQAGCRYVKIFAAGEHYRRERSALQWLRVVAPQAVPELIAHDDATMTLVTAETRGHALHELPIPHRAAAMLRLADQLGRIAEATMSSAQMAPLSALLKQMPSGYRAGHQATMALAAPLERMALDAEVDAVDAILQSSIQSLQIGDLCPDNVIVGDAQTVLLDWEFAYIGPTMMDLAAVTLSSFPTCRTSVGVESNLAQSMIERWSNTTGAALNSPTLAAAQLQWALITTGELLDLERTNQPTPRIVADRAVRLRDRCRSAATAAAELELPGLRTFLQRLADSPAPRRR
ncbi:hypothetical protein MMAGJ_63910 [Mycolicibacterium mageritense]|uniref:Aminoglycoside phosphotransferase domain-containing protein n=2 Tax=Mycolicibacterium mageritense TaxID=53462 RepID=A0ABM7I2J0_MYCME|nr:hypothetical protein MMAGJ_63910 [Mycolicibacterium mageritense]CDO26733.1 putative kinase [Mycolicibacterium mageritense DSM 44476 = CIP 104973]